MKKVKLILPLFAFLIAIGGAVLTKANPPLVNYYRWNPNNQTQCILENECGSGSKACGHATFTSGISSNCEVPVTLMKP